AYSGKKTTTPSTPAPSTSKPTPSKPKPANKGDIEAFEVEVDGKRSFVKVVYESGASENIILNFFNEGDISYELSEQYNIDIEDVKDIIDFEKIGTANIEEIVAYVHEDDDKSLIEVEYANGKTEKFLIKESDDDDIIE